MKFKLLVILLSGLFASQAFAECKSVMGTCVTQDLVNSAPHMHSEYVDKTKVAPQASKPAATSAASNSNKNTAKKTNSTGVFSTMQKTTAK